MCKERIILYLGLPRVSTKLFYLIYASCWSLEVIDFFQRLLPHASRIFFYFGFKLYVCCHLLDVHHLRCCYFPFAISTS